MSARRVLIVVTAVSFALGPLAAALPSGRTGEAPAGAQQSPRDKAQIEAALSSSKTAKPRPPRPPRRMSSRPPPNRRLKRLPP